MNELINKNLTFEGFTSICKDLMQLGSPGHEFLYTQELGYTRNHVGARLCTYVPTTGPRKHWLLRFYYLDTVADFALNFFENYQHQWYEQRPVLLHLKRYFELKLKFTSCAVFQRMQKLIDSCSVPSVKKMVDEACSENQETIDKFKDDINKADHERITSNTKFKRDIQKYEAVKKQEEVRVVSGSKYAEFRKFFEDKSVAETARVTITFRDNVKTTYAASWINNSIFLRTCVRLKQDVVFLREFPVTVTRLPDKGDWENLIETYACADFMCHDKERRAIQWRIEDSLESIDHFLELFEAIRKKEREAITLPFQNRVIVIPEGRRFPAIRSIFYCTLWSRIKNDGKSFFEKMCKEQLEATLQFLEQSVHWDDRLFNVNAENLGLINNVTFYRFAAPFLKCAERCQLSKERIENLNARLMKFYAETLFETAKKLYECAEDPACKRKGSYKLRAMELFAKAHRLCHPQAFSYLQKYADENHQKEISYRADEKMHAEGLRRRAAILKYIGRLMVIRPVTKLEELAHDYFYDGDSDLEDSDDEVKGASDSDSD